jgi:hypothetical protein
MHPRRLTCPQRNGRPAAPAAAHAFRWRRTSDFAERWGQSPTPRHGAPLLPDRAVPSPCRASVPPCRGMRVRLASRVGEREATLAVMDQASDRWVAGAHAALEQIGQLSLLCAC